MGTPLIIKDFNTGIADSPHMGHALMRNVDIESYPGSLKSSKRLTSYFAAPFAITFTVNTSTEIGTSATTIPALIGYSDYTGRPVTFSSTTTLPSPLVSGTVYFLRYITGTTFYVYDTLTNAKTGSGTGRIDFTDVGSGVHTITSLDPGTISYIVRDPRGQNYFMLDSNGRVWMVRGGNYTELLNGNTLTAASGNGLVLFQVSDASAVYLFVFRNALIDVINVTGTSDLNNPSWTTAWKSMNGSSGGGTLHHAIVGQDNIIYFCDGRFIGSIQEKPATVFVPSSSGTYTYNSKALDLPQNEVAGWLDELGTNLLVAGRTFNKIYPWDRTSDSFDAPLLCPEVGIYRLKNLGNTVYVFAGTIGNIYRTVGTYVTFFKRIPFYLASNSPTLSSNPVVWGGVAGTNNKLIFGVNFPNNTTNSGVYVCYIDGRLFQDNTPTTGAKQVDAIYADTEYYIIGYTGGADYVDVYRQASLGSVYQTGLYRVATQTIKGAYSQFELATASTHTSVNGRTGQIRASWRPDTDSAFTTLTTFNTVNAYPATSFAVDAGMTDLENVQIQLEYEGDVEILEIRLIP
jgi:hypothetical protein